MLPLLNKPVLEYMIEHLRNHGIVDIAITLSYLPSSIKNYFGDGSRWDVRISYFFEEVPLGTAGALLNAGSFIEGPCLVVSGDALTTIDFHKEAEYHQDKGGIMTIITKKSSNPFLYGAVVSRFDGKVEKVIEKPRKHEVLTDYINTGVYIVERGILSYINGRDEMDISLDLIPLLLHEKQEIYHHLTEEYWIDIGEADHYYKAQQDLLDGKCACSIKAQEIEKQVWIGKNVYIEDEVSVEGPVFLGDHTIVRKGSSIGPYAVVTADGMVEEGSSIKEAVLLQDVCVGKGSEVKKAVIDAHTALEDHKKLNHHTRMVMYSIPKEGRVSTYLHSGEEFPSLYVYHHPFVVHGAIRYSVLNERSYLFIARALSRLWKKHRKIVIGCEEEAQFLKEQMVMHLLSSGFEVHDYDLIPAPFLQDVIKKEQIDGGLYITANRWNDEDCAFIQFYEADGQPLRRNAEWQLEQLLRKHPKNPKTTLGKCLFKPESMCSEPSITNLVQTLRLPEIIGANVKVMVSAPRLIQKTVKRLCVELNVQCRLYGEADEEEWMAEIKQTKSHFAIKINGAGNRFQVFDELGQRLTETQSFCLYLFNRHLAESQIVSFSRISDEALLALNEKIIQASLLRNGKKAWIHTVPFQTNAFYAFCQLLELAATQFLPFSHIISAIPDSHIAQECVFCPMDLQGRVMRKILEDAKSHEVELIDGMKIYHSEGGWTLIMPDYQSSAINVYSEAKELFAAQELSTYFINKIKEYQKV
jgi:mannose-1-phosphate guanylyltransferase/phosphomannomutase